MEEIIYVVYKDYPYENIVLEDIKIFKNKQDAENYLEEIKDDGSIAVFGIKKMNLN